MTTLIFAGVSSVSFFCLYLLRRQIKNFYKQIDDIESLKVMSPSDLNKMGREKFRTMKSETKR